MTDIHGNRDDLPMSVDLQHLPFPRPTARPQRRRRRAPRRSPRVRDRPRSTAIDRDSMTGMYNIVAMLRSGPGVAPAIAALAPATWPAQAVDQIDALKRLASAGTTSVDEATRHFQGARRDIVARHLETLEILGELGAVESGRYAAATTG